ncbi:hypothetical protein [Thalassotalea euphylliae]|uniref:Lipoprotein n=1 Tax=Thalassotalea euphylliae TaxID=1655234 RepID=A0A3E0UEI0_9GAMM|nr:hypothetical protein [Thalassotalea euphylliae]REL35398.1 hypothetical protein DXX92_08545 [Thalassotalea euphylliae]
MLKIKSVALLMLCLVLAGCLESELEKSQKEHLAQYRQNIENIMDSYANSAAAANRIQEVHQAHITVLDNLTKVKEHFSQFEQEQKLQTIIGLYDSALTHLIVRQIQILELGQPMWNADIDKFQQIKEVNYYHQHQAVLSELLAMLDEYKDLILDHHEKVRVDLVESSLDEDDRKQIWPALNGQITIYLYSIKPKLKLIQKRAEAEMEIAEFLHEHQADYIVSQEHGLQFKTPWILHTYQTKLKLLGVL